MMRLAWDGSEDSGDSVKAPIGQPLSDLLDALADDQGKVTVAKALGVDYCTMVTCYESRHVSGRMRKALRGWQDAGGDGEGDYDGVADRSVLAKRAAELEAENRELRDLVETQGKRIAELERKAEGPEEEERQGDEAALAEAGAHPLGLRWG